MDEQEIFRRLRALLAMPPKQRPITIERLEKLAGIPDKYIYVLVDAKKLQKKTHERLSVALERVENDQYYIKKRPNKPTIVKLREPQPKQVNLTRISITENGPRIRFQAVNPRAFPELKPLKE